MSKPINMPEMVPTEKFYGLQNSLRLQLKAAVYMNSLNQTVFREKKAELCKKIKEVDKKK